MHKAMQCDIVMFLARRVVDAALLSSSVHDCYGCAEDFDSILLSDDDTKFEEILLGSHTHTHAFTRLLSSAALQVSFLYFFLLFATIVADAADAAGCCFAIYIVRLA